MAESKIVYHEGIPYDPDNPESTGIKVEGNEHPEIFEVRKASRELPNVLKKMLEKEKRKDGSDNDEGADMEQEDSSEQQEVNLYSETLDWMGNVTDDYGRARVLKELGYKRVYTSVGNMGIDEALKKGYEKNVWGMYNRTLEQIKNLVENPERSRDSSLARRILERS